VCPKCEHREVLYVPRLRDSDYNVMAVDRVSVWTAEVVGEFEAYVCLGCGYAEMYVKDVAGLRAAGVEGTKVLRAPEAPPPYR
jgi:hypothetical protein